MAAPYQDQRPYAFQRTHTESVVNQSASAGTWLRWLRRVGIFPAFLLLLLSGSLTQLAQPGSFLLTVATAHAATAATPPKDGKNTFKPVIDRGGTPHRPANQVKTAGPNKTPQAIKRCKGHLTPPFDVAIDPLAATTTTSPDGRLSVMVPAKAVTSAMVTQLGGAPHLHITQLQGPSGGSTSGHVLFGSFLITVVGPHGAVTSGSALARPITLALHLPANLQGPGADMSQVQMAVMPSDTNGNPLTPADKSAAAQEAVAAVATSASYDPTTNTLSGIVSPSSASASGGGTTVTWDTNAPDAHWATQADASVDLPSGNLTYSYPLDVPAGPGGLTPALALSYDSGSVGDNHNPAATAGWLGEGWSLTGGSISWGEHNVTSDCISTCGNTWEDSWQFSDPYGNGGELIPADSNQAPWWDDTAGGELTVQTIPMTWHLENEAGVKIFSYENPTPNPDFPSQFYPHQPPCFRAFLPNGDMEEFGCTTDSIQWYVNTNATNQNSYYPYRWDLDMIVDPSGNQIHFQYKRAMNGLAGVGGNFPIDAVLSTISYDASACHNTTTMCSGASWNPAVQIVFTSGNAPLHLNATTCTAQTYSNTTDYTSAQTMRCDDPADQTGGEKAPALQSLFVLNAVQVQVTANPGGSPTWHTLRTYNTAYENGPWTTIYDPAVGWRESVAGYLLLDSLQEVGDDNSATLPALNMSYTSYTENYLDQWYPSLKSTFCGPSWNTACKLWSQTWNTRFLSEIDNGQGWKETFTYAEAHNNTHGVNSGLNVLDPLACNGQRSGTNPCGKADDQNWSRIVLTKRVGEVQCVTLQGGACAGSNNGLAHDSTWSYTYTLTDVSSANMAQECGDCLQTMYWGNQNDGDVSDFYNAHFAGFKNVNVTSPDGSLQTYTYYTTKGYGVANTGITCDSGNGCDVSPWTDPLNALHGRAQEEDDYDTNATTLLKQTLTTYAVTCPPNGVSASAHNTVDPHNYYVGQNTSELDHNNPLVTCRIDTTQVDTYQVDGGSPLSGTHTTVTYTYTYGSSTHLATLKEDQSSSNTGATHIITTTQYIWHDALTVAAKSATGVYFDRLPGKVQLQSESGGYKGCTYYGYDSGAAGLVQNQTSVTRGLRTTTTQYATDCDPGAESGAVTTKTAYNTNGDLLATEDADALGAVSGHTNATSCTINAVAYSACANYDSLYGTQVTNTYNALRHDLTLNYTTDGANTNSSDATNGWGQWLTTSTDANLRVSAYGYDPLGRLTATALPNSDTLSSPTNSYQYLVTCPATGASTPCAALVTTQRLASSTTTTSATYYDGWGHPIETVTPAFDAPDGSQTKVTYSVTYTMYDPSNRKNFVSDPYFVSQDWSGAIGTPPYFPPDNTVAGTTTRYDGLGRVTVVFDPLGHSATTTYSEQQPQGANVTDTGVYAATTVKDANSHNSATLTDGLGRAAYTEQFNAAGALARTTRTTYDYLGDATAVYGPTPSGPAGVSTTPQTTKAYDLLGRKTGMSDADLGSGWQYGYDPNDNQISVIDPRGVSGGAVYAGYDGLNRPLWRNATTSSPTGAYVTYTYDQTTAHGYGIGHLTSESFTGGDVNQPLHGGYSYYYGARGEITNFTLTTTKNASYTLAYGYNDALQQTSLTYSDGEVFTTQYNNEDWLAGAVTTPSGGSAVNLLTNVSYSGVGGAAGHITTANLGNGTYALSASYDNALRFTSLTLTTVSLGTTVFGTQRSYDAVGNVIGVNTTLANGTDNQAFCYDSVNRLYWAGSTGTPSCGWSLTPGTLTAANYTATYNYDATNRITGGSLGTLTYGDSNHVHGATSSSSGETASYDTNGDMQCRAPTSATTCAGTSPTGAHLDYDAERRLTHWQNAPSNPTSQAWYLYDGDGQRVEQYVSGGSGNHTYYLPGGVEEVTPSGSLIKYYNAGDMMLGLNTAHDASGISYLASDGLGSISEALGSNGTATGAQFYSPYGGVRYTTGTMPTSKGFTGQYADTSNGQDYYRARYYDPSLGQFTSADTVADGVNRYGYVKGNPETSTDPTGHCPWCLVGAIVGGVIGLGVGVGSAIASGQPLTWGTVGRIAADTALGAGAGLALTAEPVGALIGIAGSLAGEGLGLASGGSFDLQSTFESVAIGSITGGLGVGLLKSAASIADVGLASFARVGGLAAISAAGDAASQLVGQLGTNQPFNYNVGETILSATIGGASGTPGAFLDAQAANAASSRSFGQSASSTAANGAIDSAFQMFGSTVVGGIIGKCSTKLRQSSRLDC